MHAWTQATTNGHHQVKAPPLSNCLAGLLQPVSVDERAVYPCAPMMPSCSSRMRAHREAPPLCIALETQQKGQAVDNLARGST